MQITIIGSGNVATALGKIFIKGGYTIHEIAGRNKAAVQNLARALHAKPCFTLKEIDNTSEIFIVAVKDDAVAEVAAQIQLKQKIVAHTCGSLSMKVLDKTSENYGVLYPLQSLRKEVNYNPVIPFLVDGNNQYTKNFIYKFATAFATNIIQADDETRLRYHLSAIVVSNFTNHLFTLTKHYCDEHNINFRLLLPLIEETVNRMHYYHPGAMQTGPAARGDKTVMQKHISMLEQNPALKKIYELMSESIQINKLQ